jgi:hypothetical protein
MLYSTVYMAENLTARQDWSNTYKRVIITNISSLCGDWEKVEGADGEEERIFLIRELLRELPPANQDNIAAIFRFLARLGMFTP